MENGAKESGTTKKVTLEELAKRVEALEERANLRDQPVGRPNFENCNTDPGPWVKAPRPE